MNKQRSVATLAILFVMVFFVGAYYVQKNLLPQQLRAIQANLNVPIRYAFVTDSNGEQLAVLDTYEKSLLNTITLSARADFVAVSRLGGFLAYAEQGDSSIYLIDLEEKITRRMTVNDEISGLSVHFNGQWLVYHTRNAVVILDRDGNEQRRLKTSHSVSLTYHLDGQRLFIADLSQGIIWQYFWHSQQFEKLLSLGRKISPLSVMSDGSALIFAVESGDSALLQRYSLVDQALTNSDIDVALLRPYITSDSQLILAVESLRGASTLLQIDTQRMTVKQRFSVGELAIGKSVTADWIRTGWLEQVAIVAGNQALYTIDLGGQSVVKKIPLPGNVKNMLVQSDTKTLLATVSDSQELQVLDLRTQTLSPSISLPFKQPNIVVMGQTNTLCH